MNRRQFVRNTVAAGLAVRSAASLAQPGTRGAEERDGLLYVMFSKKLKEQSIDQLIESLKFVGADGVGKSGRPHRRAVDRSQAWRDRSHRGPRAGHVHIGVLPGTWESRSSPQ